MGGENSTRGIKRRNSSISTHHRVQRSLLHGNAMYEEAIERIRERQKAIRRRQQLLKEEPLKECTFQPKLNHQVINFDKTSTENVSGFQTYVQRQKRGKKLNKQRELEKNRLGFRSNLYINGENTNFIFDDYHYHLQHMDEPYDAAKNQMKKFSETAK